MFFLMKSEYQTPFPIQKPSYIPVFTGNSTLAVFTDSPETLSCVLEQRHVHCLLLAQLKKTGYRPDMAENLGKYS